MRTILNPTVYLLNAQAINDHELDRFLGDHDVHGWETDTEVGAEKTVEVGGRLCYMSFAKPRPGGNEGYIKHLLEVGHGSVLEHAVFTVVITGVSRSFTHELVRHRAGFSYSQLSQRYVDESVCEVVVPHHLKAEILAAQAFVAIRQAGDTYEKVLTVDLIDYWLTADAEDWKVSLTVQVRIGLMWLRNMLRNNEDYRILTEYLVGRQTAAVLKEYGLQASTDLHQEQRTAIRKDARGTARSVLPNATETKIQVTANARAWRGFLDQRATKAAEVEARKVAHEVWHALYRAAPHLFQDYAVHRLPDGTLALETPYKKV
jgi:thymidylate synthase (FAD)